MADSDNLISKIGRLAATDDVYEQGRRVLAADTGDGVLAAILQEIDDTVLERQLVFHAQPGHSVSLAAKGRRLLMVCKVAPTRDTEILSVYLSGQDAEHMAALGKVMVGFAAGAKNLSVAVGEVEQSGDGAALGISVQALRAAWLGDARADGSEIAQFLRACDGQVSAYVHMENDTLVSEAGEGDQLALVQELAAERIAEIDGQLRRFQGAGGPDKLVVIDRNPSEFICYGRKGEGFTVLLITVEKLPVILSMWQHTTVVI